MTKEKWQPRPSLPSPNFGTGVVGWSRKNLFSTPWNSLLTLLGVAILAISIPPFIQWAILQANWLGDSREVCDAAAAKGSAGACWVFINVRKDVFLYGFYPELERWRVNYTFLLLAFSLLPLLLPNWFKRLQNQFALGIAAILCAFIIFGVKAAVFTGAYLFLPIIMARLVVQNIGGLGNGNGRFNTLLRLGLTVAVGLVAYYFVFALVDPNGALPIAMAVAVIALFLLFMGKLDIAIWRWIFLFTVFPVVAFFMLSGDVFGLPLVETHYWGGLFLSLVVSGTGLGTALPIGILLALGRRSELPVIRVVCVTFIEFIRGVPLVSVLFLASVMFPLFLPDNFSIDKLLRALVGIAFFYAAYMAEVIRGGLQAIPKGQYEAAEALGWTYWKMMGLIILPQTLRVVIPGLSNNFLSLLKDTTLVAVIGLLDLLGIAKAAMADTEWLGFTKEAYIFAGIVFWILCFAMSRYFVYLEKKYHMNYQ
ncbi:MULTISPECIES: amino acid ABC transporter permease [Desulfosediminicola]|uniref:amino acid ABC transporter permease n=1 Tax=Desulfosediminicola TaxID=2886823 RepID=UPI0010AB552E|nr:amino acid ABC transporter permease [Desulfosediminicola ganghwensis]